jgi:hypothetical protein
MSEKRAALNAFSPEFLRALREWDEPETPAGVESGPALVLRRSGSTFALFRSWRSSESGDVPEATFETREDALIFLAARDALSRSRRYEMGTSQGGRPSEGFVVEKEGGPAGWLRTFDPDWVFSANTVAAVAHSSEDLALVVRLSGPSRQEEIGEILARAVLLREADEAEE